MSDEALRGPIGLFASWWELNFSSQKTASVHAEVLAEVYPSFLLTLSDLDGAEPKPAA
jgi:hypothetical protein